GRLLGCGLGGGFLLGRRLLGRRLLGAGPTRALGARPALGCYLRGPRVEQPNRLLKRHVLRRHVLRERGVQLAALDVGTEPPLPAIDRLTSTLVAAQRPQRPASPRRLLPEQFERLLGRDV